ncbi:nose resistant to fluoxetine protein 6 [Caerostris darwini]|uniref:Nose resistant to fluoxetine protein 6 n=1 Tax=Caerostris darwini TaxID=1538125 RepID=A0AAV4TQV7_9ARAC|nr:nose resistant to fluoxetine protein 6 [Caerostris darwini]
MVVVVVVSLMEGWKSGAASELALVVTRKRIKMCVINYILSWDCFIPLGRLTFVVYLIHPLVQILVIGNMHTHIQPSHFVAVWLFFGHTIATYGAAFVGTMLLESPVLTLEKIMFGKAEKVDDNNANKSNSNLNGTLKVEKNGDIASMVMNDNEKSSNTISSIA